MKWRLRYLECRCTKKDNIVIKLRLGTIKLYAYRHNQFTNPDDSLTKDYEKLGKKKIEDVPPLLDPDLPIDKAISLHKIYKKSEKIDDIKNKFLS